MIAPLSYFPRLIKISIISETTVVSLPAALYKVDPLVKTIFRDI